MASVRISDSSSATINSIQPDVVTALKKRKKKKSEIDGHLESLRQCNPNINNSNLLLLPPPPPPLPSHPTSDSRSAMQFEIVQRTSQSTDRGGSLKLKIAATRTKPNNNKDLIGSSEPSEAMRASLSNIASMDNTGGIYSCSNLRVQKFVQDQQQFMFGINRVAGETLSNAKILPSVSGIVGNGSIPVSQSTLITDQVQPLIGSSNLFSIETSKKTSDPAAVNQDPKSSLCNVKHSVDKLRKSRKERFEKRKQVSSSSSSSSSCSSSSSSASSRSNSCSKGSRSCGHKNFHSKSTASSSSSSSSSSRSSSSTSSSSSSNSSRCSSRSCSSHSKNSSRSNSSCASSSCSSRSSTSASRINSPCLQNLRKELQATIVTTTNNVGQEISSNRHKINRLNGSQAKSLKQSDNKSSIATKDISLVASSLKSDLILEDVARKNDKTIESITSQMVDSPMSTFSPSQSNAANSAYAFSQPSSVSCESVCYSPAVSVNSPGPLSTKKRDPAEERQRLRSYRIPHLQNRDKLPAPTSVSSSKHQQTNPSNFKQQQHNQQQPTTNEQIAVSATTTNENSQEVTKLVCKLQPEEAVKITTKKIKKLVKGNKTGTKKTGKKKIKKSKQLTGQETVEGKSGKKLNKKKGKKAKAKQSLTTADAGFTEISQLAADLVQPHENVSLLNPINVVANVPIVQSSIKQDISVPLNVSAANLNEETKKPATKKKKKKPKTATVSNFTDAPVNQLPPNVHTKHPSPINLGHKLLPSLVPPNQMVPKTGSVESTSLANKAALDHLFKETVNSLDQNLLIASTSLFQNQVNPILAVPVQTTSPFVNMEETKTSLPTNIIQLAKMFMQMNSTNGKSLSESSISTSIPGVLLTKVSSTSPTFVSATSTTHSKPSEPKPLPPIAAVLERAAVVTPCKIVAASSTTSNNNSTSIKDNPIPVLTKKDDDFDLLVRSVNDSISSQFVLDKEDDFEIGQNNARDRLPAENLKGAKNFDSLVESRAISTLIKSTKRAKQSKAKKKGLIVTNVTESNLMDSTSGTILPNYSTDQATNEFSKKQEEVSPINSDKTELDGIVPARSVSSLSEQSRGRKKKKIHRKKNSKTIEVSAGQPKADGEMQVQLATLMHDLKLSNQQLASVQSQLTAKPAKSFRNRKKTQQSKQVVVQLDPEDNSLTSGIDRLPNGKKRRKQSSSDGKRTDKKLADKSGKHAEQLMEEEQLKQDPNEHSLPLKKRHHRHTESKQTSAWEGESSDSTQPVDNAGSGGGGSSSGGGSSERDSATFKNLTIDSLTEKSTAPTFIDGHLTKNRLTSSSVVNNNSIESSNLLKKCVKETTTANSCAKLTSAAPSGGSSSPSFVVVPELKTAINSANASTGLLNFSSVKTIDSTEIVSDQNANSNLLSAIFDDSSATLTELIDSSRPSDEDSPTDQSSDGEDIKMKLNDFPISSSRRLRSNQYENRSEERNSSPELAQTKFNDNRKAVKVMSKTANNSEKSKSITVITASKESVLQQQTSTELIKPGNNRKKKKKKTQDNENVVCDKQDNDSRLQKDTTDKVSKLQSNPLNQSAKTTVRKRRKQNKTGFDKPKKKKKKTTLNLMVESNSLLPADNKSVEKVEEQNFKVSPEAQTFTELEPSNSRILTKEDKKKDSNTKNGVSSKLKRKRSRSLASESLRTKKFCNESLETSKKKGVLVGERKRKSSALLKEVRLEKRRLRTLSSDEDSLLTTTSATKINSESAKEIAPRCLRKSSRKIVQDESQDEKSGEDDDQPVPSVAKEEEDFEEIVYKIQGPTSTILLKKGKPTKLRAQKGPTKKYLKAALFSSTFKEDLECGDYVSEATDSSQTNTSAQNTPVHPFEAPSHIEAASPSEFMEGFMSPSINEDSRDSSCNVRKDTETGGEEENGNPPDLDFARNGPYSLEIGDEYSTMLPPPTYVYYKQRRKLNDFLLPYDIWWQYENKQLSSQMNPTKNYKKIKGNVFFDVKPTSKFEEQSCVCERPKSNNQKGCGGDCLNRAMYVECNPSICPCGDQCSNQKLLRNEWSCGLERFLTKERGWGVRTSEFISKSSFIMEYIGEVVSEKVFMHRMVENYKNDPHHYCLNIMSGVVIDGYRMANEGRFVNHSCEPNCEMQKWSVNGYYRVGLFALRDIEPGEEVTYDYNFDNFNLETQQVCMCGSSKCRGFIGGKSQSNGKERKHIPSNAGPIEKMNIVKSFLKKSINRRKDGYLTKVDNSTESGSQVILFEKKKAGELIKPLSYSNCNFILKHSVFLIRNFERVKRIHNLAIEKERKQRDKESDIYRVDRKENREHFNPNFLSNSRSVRTRGLAKVQDNKELIKVYNLSKVFKEIIEQMCQERRETAGFNDLINLAQFLPKKKKDSVLYTKVINPIDLNTINNKIASGYYKTLESFKCDFTNLVETLTILVGDKPSSKQFLKSFQKSFDRVLKEKVLIISQLCNETNGVEKISTDDSCPLKSKTEGNQLESAIDLPMQLRISLAAITNTIDATFELIKSQTKMNQLVRKKAKSDDFIEKVVPNYEEELQQLQIELPKFRENSTPEEEEVIRCICGINRDEGTMIQCDRCLVWQHAECLQANVQADTYLCEKCDARDYPNEIKIHNRSSDFIDKWEYYMTLTNGDLLVRQGDCVYLDRDHGKSASLSKPVGKSFFLDYQGNKVYKSEVDIFHVERLYIDENGKKFVFGHHYLRPSESFHEPSRKFFTNEVLSSPLGGSAPIESVKGICLVMDLATYCKGRPVGVREEDIYVCEFKVCKRARSFTRVGKNYFAINTRSYCFKFFDEKINPKRQFSPHNILKVKKDIKEKLQNNEKLSKEEKNVVEKIKTHNIEIDQLFEIHSRAFVSKQFNINKVIENINAYRLAQDEEDEEDENENEEKKEEKVLSNGT